jgi:hypothetical protein
MVVDIAFIWVYFVAKYWKEMTMYAYLIDHQNKFVPALFNDFPNI